jgi:drug/metabolite transporter (DMT)-like permease
LPVQAFVSSYPSNGCKEHVLLVFEGFQVISTQASYATLLVLGPVLTGLFFVAALWMTRRVGATYASTITFISTVFTLLLGSAFLAENIGILQLVGMATIFAGLLAIDGSLLARFDRGEKSSA